MVDEDLNGLTPLHCTSFQDHVDVVNELLLHQADVNSIGRNGWSLLHLACEGRQTDTVMALLAHGANVDVANVQGETAL